MKKDIIRFYKSNKKILIMHDVTLEQAQEWCSSPLTRKEGKYFDGFDNVNTHCVEQNPKYTHYFTPNETYN